MAFALLSSWPTVAAAIAAVAIWSQLIYRWLFHPLRSFPGPWSHGVTDIPSALKLSSGLQHCHYYNLHRKYGSVVRVAPNELLFTSADAWEDIYGYRKGKVMEKSPIFIGVASPMNGYVGVGLAKGKEHTRQRKALAPALSKNALYGQEEIIQRHITALIEALRKTVARGEPANMSDYYSFITFDVIGDLSYGEPFGCLAQGSATEWAKSIINVTIFATYDQAIRKVAGVDTWFRTLLIKAFMPAEVAKWRILHMQKSKDKTLQRLANKETTNKDVIHHLLQNEDSISPWVAGRSPSNFHNPDSFRPERWLQENPDFAQDRLNASRPFGHGPKKCIGEDLSFLEMRLIGSHLLSTFDLELDMTGERRKDNEMWCLTPQPETLKLYQVLLKPNLWVRLTERQ